MTTQNKVSTVNDLNQSASRWVPVLQNVLRPFMGQKIITNRGKIFSSVKKEISKISVISSVNHNTYGPNSEIIIQFDVYDVYGFVKATTKIKVATIKDRKLIALDHFYPERYNFQVDEVKNAVEKIESMRQSIKNLEKEYFQFLD